MHAAVGIVIHIPAQTVETRPIGCRIPRCMADDLRPVGFCQRR